MFGRNKWVAIGQSNIGKSHIESNIPCQDSINYVCSRTGLFCSLCDGLGSKSKSEIGSEYVSNNIVNLLQNKFDELYSYEPRDLSLYIIDEIKKNLINDLELKDKSLDDFKTTLVFLAIRKGKYIVGSIGDSKVGLLKNGEPIYLSDTLDKRLEYANSTYTIFDDDAVKHLHVEKGVIDDSFDSVFMISDGLPFLANSGKIAPKLTQYLGMLNNTAYGAVNTLVNKTLQKIIDSKPSCVDDWSYIFIKKVDSKEIAKTYYTSNITKKK